MSLEEGDEGATFGAGLQQPNFAPGQCFLLARMSYIMVVVCVYCIFYIYIYICCIYIIYIWMVNWNDYNRLQSNMGSHAEAKNCDQEVLPHLHEVHHWRIRRRGGGWHPPFSSSSWSQMHQVWCASWRSSIGNSWFFEMSLWKWNIQPEGGVGFKNSFNRNSEWNCRSWLINSNTFLKP